MKNFLNPLILIFGIFALVTFSSCGEDDPVIDPGLEGINVSDGLYLALEGEDPSSTAQLTAEVVETDGFASKDRAGFVGGYMWLDAGDYNVVQVTAKELTQTIGGTSEVIEDLGSECDANTYTVVSTAVGGPAFAVATSGLYKVTHDQLTNEVVLYQIVEPTIIGGATPDSGDTKLTGSVTSDGGSWEVTGLIMRNGTYKIRMNCRWTLDRRIDSNAGFEDANGYQFFTNFGTDINNLEIGGSDMTQSEDGEYTMTIDWDPRNGWSATQVRTGDAPTVSFDPNDFRWAVIGDATAGAWETDRDLFYKDGGDGVHNWYGVVTFAEAGNFKLRINDEWNLALGGSLPADGTPTEITSSGGDMPSPGAGDFYIHLTTSDDGATWTATMTEFGWSLIGAGGPAASWEIDTDMVADGFADGISTYSFTGDFAGGSFKFRAGHAWDLNLGGDAAALVVDGGDLSTEAGTKTVVLSFDGSNYTATIQ